MQNTVFNPIQQHLLKLFAYDSTEETLKEMKTVLANYYADKLDRLTDELWDSGAISQEKLDEIRHVHVRDLLKK